jgi:hypothetical protein
LPPLAILQTSSTLAAVDVSGKVQWSLTQAEVNKLLSAAAHDTITARVAGPDVILSLVTAGSPPKGRLVVLDGTGTSLGGFPFIPNYFTDDVFGNAAGSEWAYSVDDSSASAARHHGRIVVAGISTAPHTLFSWVAPAGGFSEQVAAWTDMGIVMERIGLGGCGLGFHPDTASFLIDPVTGTLTSLFSAGVHYGDARHGVRTAFAAQSPSAVMVNGSTFDEVGTVATGLVVSPTGASVGVRRFTLGGCDAGSPATVRTELIDVASGAHTDLAGCGINGWFDATDFVCNAFGDTAQRIEDLTGHPGAVLGRGSFVGVLSGG